LKRYTLQLESKNNFENNEILKFLCSEDVDEYARLINAVFALNIVSLIAYYLSVASDIFLHKQERKFYKNIAYESV